jgi:hypothetical protein
MAVIIRIVVLAVTLVVAFGLILHNVVTYSPAFPLVILANSLACLAAGLTANRVGRDAGRPADAVGGLAYTAVVGGGLMLLFAGISAIFAAVGGGKGGIVSSHGSALLLDLSWPAAVIALAAMVTGIRAYRRVGQRPDRSLA